MGSTNNNDNIVISLKNVCRGYGKTKVIDNLNLEIKGGTIACLLGASGSGKTTILRTILGRLIPDSGEVLIFGKEPYKHNDNKFRVPGHAVGFCPQEGALYHDLTMDHTLNFFSNIHSLPNDEFEKKKSEIIKLLDLKDILSRSAGLLSGGQKKRLSLAVALLHSPKLLILDEPTVGIDMQVASDIWAYLKQLANSGVTIIITTHYINEAVGSDRVFLLRDGKILENGNPHTLIRKYNSPNLEDVFLKLCKRDSTLANSNNNNNNINNTIDEVIQVESHTAAVIESSSPSTNDNENYNENTPLIGISSDSNSNSNSDNNINRFKIILQAFAIAKRKFIQIYRNKVVLAFELLSPTVQILLYFLAVGGTPKNLNFGVVNADVGFMNVNLGNQYIGALSTTGIFNFHQYNSTEYGIEQIKQGNSLGLIDINSNFTSANFEKFVNPQLYNPDSQINLYMDFTNYQITLLVEQQLELAFENLANSTLNITMNPVNIVTPTVFGDPNAKFVSFLAPGMIGLITFAHAISITSVSFVREKIDGSLDRLFAYGVRTSSIVFGHFLGHLPLLLLQITVLLLIAIYGFNIPIEGDIALVFLITVMLAFSGMSLGLVISAVSRIETEAIQLSLGVYFPILIASGTIWPIQAIPKYFQWFPVILPTTWAASALRDVMLKGVGFHYKEVWMAFLIVIAWLLFLVTVAILALNEKDKNFNFFKKKSTNKQQ